MQFYQDFGDSEKMKFRRLIRLFVLLVNLFAAVLIVSYAASAWKEIRSVTGSDQELHVSVSGEGKVSARPDIAKINAAIMSEGQYLKDVQDVNSKKSNVLVAYLKSVGVGDGDIKTVGYNISPQYRYPPPCYYSGVCPQESGQPQIIGYQIRNAFEVKVRDLEKASEILAGVVGAGANEVSGIAFTIDEPDQLQADARKKAIDQARVKAETLAKDLGRRVGAIISFSEGGSFPPIIYDRALVAEGGKGGGGAPAPSVQPGENEIVVSVSITYELR